jgi:hypothetical protein
MNAYTIVVRNNFSDNLETSGPELSSLYMRLFVRLPAIALLTSLSACSTSLSPTSIYPTPARESINYLDPDRTPHVLVFDHRSASGYTIEYFLSRDSIRVLRQCDFTPCTMERVSYKQQVDEASSKAFGDLLRTLRVDTLKNYYFTPGGCGLERSVLISWSAENYKSVLLVRYSHPVISVLISQIRNLIEDERIRNL